MDLKLITQAGDLKGKKVLVRSSCNVPLVNGEVRNSFRLRRAVPTLKFLSEQGAKTIVVSHIGRDTTDTLLPVFTELNIMIPLTWAGTIGSTEYDTALVDMKDGEILFCENLRQDAREEDNDPGLVEILKRGMDLYVNDAFAEAHRNHASTFGVAQKLPAYAGLTLAEEVSGVNKVMNPEKPSLFLLGGAKFETKMPLVEKYLELYDHVFVGGALTNDVLKARGFEVGQSLVSGISLVDAPFLNNKKLLLPIDLVVNGPNGKQVKKVDAVLPEEKIFDLGPETVAMLSRYVTEAKTILWNGPFGNYEAGYVEGTEEIAKVIAKASGYSVIGGGDTVAAVEKLGLNDQFGFVSIGGGSMLTLLEHGTTNVLDTLK